MKMTAQGFVLLRKSLGVLNTSQVAGITYIVDAIDQDQTISYAQAAYILATVWHETARTMQPIKEQGSERYLKAKPYYPFIGYGYVQLTWKYNYAFAGRKLGIDLLSKPELALTIEVATKIMLLGMKEGWFTGKKLSDYINISKKDYINARRIINGTDQAQKIATYAKYFEDALRSL